jgi:hypothetical protein
MAEVSGPLNAKTCMKAPLPFKFWSTPKCFNGGSLGPLNAKTYVKALLAFRFLPTPMCFNGGCESSVGLRFFAYMLRWRLFFGPLDAKLYVKASWSSKF